MTNLEFSNEFDALLSSYSYNPSFGKTDNLALDEYEKSLFLTKAQEEIVIELYNSKNPFGDSFEKTEEIRRYLSSLINTKKLNISNDNYIGLSQNSKFVELPKELLFITYESAILKSETSQCINNKEVQVLPVTQDEYHRIKDNPFRGPTDNRILRLDYTDGIVELISKFDISYYLVRYLSRPEPIILQDLEDVTINEEKKYTECKLNPVLHRTILDRAVKLALASKSLSAGK